MSFALAAILATSLTACDNNKVEEKTEEKETLPNVKEQAKQNANQAETGGIVVEGLIIGESGPGQKVGAAYFTLKNQGTDDVSVTAVKSDVSEVTEFHTMEMKDSKMIMRKMDEVVIPANGSLILKQGGDHLMFIGLEKPLMAGDKVNVTVDFNNGESVKISGQVNATDGMEEMSHDDAKKDNAAHGDMHEKHDNEKAN